MNTMKSKYKIGDSVRIINGYGIMLDEKTVSDISFIDGRYRYFVRPSNPAWCSYPEERLVDSQTYDAVYAQSKMAAGSGDKYLQEYSKGTPLFMAVLEGYAHGMSPDAYYQLVKELEQLELIVAKGEETPGVDKRMGEIDNLMLVSPWTLDPDSNQVVERHETVSFEQANLGP